MSCCCVVAGPGGSFVLADIIVGEWLMQVVGKNELHDTAGLTVLGRANGSNFNWQSTCFDTSS